MAYAQAMCHPLPALFNARISISEQEIINQMRWSAPVFPPNDLIDGVIIPNLVDRPDAITPLTDDVYPLSFGGKWRDAKNVENIPSQLLSIHGL